MVLRGPAGASITNLAFGGADRSTLPVPTRPRQHPGRAPRCRRLPGPRRLTRKFPPPDAGTTRVPRHRGRPGHPGELGSHLAGLSVAWLAGAAHPRAGRATPGRVEDTRIARTVAASTPADAAGAAGIRLPEAPALVPASRSRSAQKSLDVQYLLARRSRPAAQLRGAARGGAGAPAGGRPLHGGQGCTLHGAGLAAHQVEVRVFNPLAGVPGRVGPDGWGSRCTSSGASTIACTTSCSWPTTAWPVSGGRNIAQRILHAQPPMRTSSTWTCWPPAPAVREHVGQLRSLLEQRGTVRPVTQVARGRRCRTARQLARPVRAALRCRASATCWNRPSVSRQQAGAGLRLVGARRGLRRRSDENRAHGAIRDALRRQRDRKRTLAGDRLGAVAR